MARRALFVALQVRGLSSSNDGARQGYSTALVELLRDAPIVTTAEVLQMVNEIIEIGGQLALYSLCSVVSHF
jgi:hypothetical protein